MAIKLLLGELPEPLAYIHYSLTGRVEFTTFGANSLTGNEPFSLHCTCHSW